LKDNRILHQGQHLAVVVARTREQAAAAARLVEIDYEEAAPVLSIDDPRAPYCSIAGDGTSIAVTSLPH
jgi:CO/xanthine dehydrogenase Mo-binding subunit